jgi:hypothetical protein
MASVTADAELRLLTGPTTLFVSFVPHQRVDQARLIDYLDHMRTTSIPSSYGTFTSHLHINA